MSTSSPVIRLRHRPRQQLYGHPTATELPTVSDFTAEKSRLAHVLAQVHDGTPPRLRQLEKGWRERRKVLGDISNRKSAEYAVPPSVREDGRNETNKSRQLELDSGSVPVNHPKPSRRSSAGIIDPLPSLKQPRTTSGVRFNLTRPPTALPTPPTTPPTPSNHLDDASSTTFEQPAPAVYSPQTSAFRASASNVNSLQAGEADTIPRYVLGSSPLPRRSDSGRARAVAGIVSAIQPILARPLAPSLYPIRLSYGGKDTIHILPSNSTVEITLTTRSGRMLQISAGGTQMTWNGGYLAKSKILRLDQSDRWSDDEKREWKIVYDLVQDFKRRTPRVKFFDPLGHLTITCSSPPDIILSFHLHSSGSQHKRSPSVESPRASATTDSPSTLKVRIMYSRISGELRIDTSFMLPPVKGEKAREKLYTKRVLPMLQIPYLTRFQIEEDDQGYEGLLGLDCQTSGWAAEEKDALRRLWGLRRMWTIWDSS